MGVAVAVGAQVALAVVEVEELDAIGADLVVDGLLGTGVRGAPRERQAAVIDRIASRPEAASSSSSTIAPSGSLRTISWSVKGGSR